MCNTTMQTLPVELIIDLSFRLNNINLFVTCKFLYGTLLLNKCIYKIIIQNMDYVNMREIPDEIMKRFEQSEIESLIQNNFFDMPIHLFKTLNTAMLHFYYGWYLAKTQHCDTPDLIKQITRPVIKPTKIEYTHKKLADKSITPQFNRPKTYQIKPYQPVDKRTRMLSILMAHKKNWHLVNKFLAMIYVDRSNLSEIACYYNWSTYIDVTFCGNKNCIEFLIYHKNYNKLKGIWDIIEQRTLLRYYIYKHISKYHDWTLFFTLREIFSLSKIQAMDELETLLQWIMKYNNDYLCGYIMDNCCNWNHIMIYNKVADKVRHINYPKQSVNIRKFIELFKTSNREINMKKLTKKSIDKYYQ